MNTKVAQPHTDCRHHWHINEYNEGRCIYCGATKQFPTWQEIEDKIEQRNKLFFSRKGGLNRWLQ